jgi:hypothetical protein
MPFFILRNKYEKDECPLFLRNTPIKSIKTRKHKKKNTDKNAKKIKENRNIPANNGASIENPTRGASSCNACNTI